MPIKKALAALALIASLSATAFAGEIDLPGSPASSVSTTSLIVWILTGQIS
jgi:hypothetical protein